MQTCHRLPLRPSDEKQNRGRAIAAPVWSLNFSIPSRRPHRPRSTTRTASRRPDAASGLPSCRARNAASFPARRRAGLQSCLQDGSLHGVRRVAPLPPSQLNRGRSRPRPRSPWPWGSARPPALVALARALLRACTRPRASMVCGALHRPDIFPHTTRPLIPAQARARRRAPPDRDGGDAAPPVSGLAGKKEKQKREGGWGWWWQRV
jgi:hypothetical protein